MQSTLGASYKEEITKTIAALRTTSPEFDHAYDTYVSEYGVEKVYLGSELTDLKDTVDPVAITLGRNCTVFYSDSKKSLRGSLGAIEFKKDTCYILGRRQPQDQKVVCWGPDSVVELEEYNSRASIIPSRVHGAFIYSDGVRYLDIGSSSGTVLVGESLLSGPFVRVYDSGALRPSINIDRINTAMQPHKV